MKKGGGKQKGASFERDVCVKLSRWVSDGAADDIFWRSSMSGGRSTIAHAKGKRLAAQAGDISCIHPLGHLFMSKFVVECKFYKDLKYHGLLTGTGHLVEFWQTVKAEAKRYNKMPLMIAKQNQLPTVACLTLRGLTELGLKGTCVLIAPKGNLHAVLFDDYLKHAQRLKEVPNV
jgi:hypothetical protein